MEFAKSVNVLGTEYKIHIHTEDDDEKLKECNGYCDKTTKDIVIVDMSNTKSNLGNPDWYSAKLLRHEIVHAFLFESGLHENTNSDSVNTHDEQMVDWIALQGEKIHKAWQEVGCLG
jgi:hypothetical protein